MLVSPKRNDMCPGTAVCVDAPKDGGGCPDVAVGVDVPTEEPVPLGKTRRGLRDIFVFLFLVAVTTLLFVEVLYERGACQKRATVEIYDGRLNITLQSVRNFTALLDSIIAQRMDGGD